jgi:hypothetical protein
VAFVADGSMDHGMGGIMLMDSWFRPRLAGRTDSSAMLAGRQPTSIKQGVG